jgi:hypothetical protein
MVMNLAAIFVRIETSFSGYAALIFGYAALIFGYAALTLRLCRSVCGKAPLFRRCIKNYCGYAALGRGGAAESS